MAAEISDRASKLIHALDVPWRWAPRGTYSPRNSPDGLVTFATAENTLIHPELDKFTCEKVRIPQDALTYQYSTAGGARLPILIAQHLNEHFKPARALNGSEIRVTGAATAMHEILGWAVGDLGDGILTSRPAYGRLELDFGNKAGLSMVYADDTNWCNAFDPPVVYKFERAMAASPVRVRALFIINPHNPVGRCYPRETLVEIMRFCQKHQIHLISDEIYGSSVFRSTDDPKLPDFTSVLAIEPGVIDDRLLHVTYGFSKDFGAAGLRLGCIITRSPRVLDVVQMAMRFHNPSGASVAIFSAILEDRNWCNAFLAESRRKIGEAYAFVTAGLTRMGISFVSAIAGFFVYVDLSPFLTTIQSTAEGKEEQDPEFALAQKFLDAGVFLHPKEEHGGWGWFRIVYTQERHIVTEGLRRMEVVLGQINH
ncbi:putative aspartate aminotransferase [Microdochium bolleyi]|uniref:Putative aspartate aminotransferase n=1 Tax=Microdochium bolleyi TaxID=196109 RepID=A0A136ITU0_9PEZI|nr:putative aspartate aminotransferase [Microdochium bolleyi]